MALAESQCYTIINTPEISDIYNEMKLKKDLGIVELNSIFIFQFYNIYTLIFILFM